MRLAFFLILLALGAYGIYHYAKPGLDAAASDPTPTPAPAQSQAATAAAADQKAVAAGKKPLRVTCPVCTGEGSLKMRRNTTGFDLKQSCPICMGKGFRDVTIPVGRKLCPDCRGMGSVSVRSNLSQKLSCARCLTTGTVQTVVK
jgi:DnaJ-class molecular chaperone